MVQYRQRFESYAEQYQELSTTQGSLKAFSSDVQTSRIDALFDPDFHQSGSCDELTQYLESAKWSIFIATTLLLIS